MAETETTLSIASKKNVWNKNIVLYITEEQMLCRERSLTFVLFLVKSEEPKIINIGMENNKSLEQYD